MRISLPLTASCLLVLTLLLSPAAQPSSAQQPEGTEASSAESSPESQQVGEAEGEVSPLEALETAQSELERLQRLYDKAEGEFRMLYGELVLTQSNDVRQRLNELVEAVVDESLPDSVDRDRAMAVARDALERQGEWLPAYLDTVGTWLVERHAQLAQASDEQRIELEEEVNLGNALITEILTALVENLENREKLDLQPATALGSLVDRRLQERADLSKGRILVAQRQVRDLRLRLRSAPQAQKDAMQKQVAAYDQELALAQQALEDTIELMQRRGLEMADLQEILVESRGAVTAEVLDPRVAARLVERSWRRIRTAIIEAGPQWLVAALAFLVVLAVAWLLSRWVRRLLAHWFRRSPVRSSQLLQQFTISTASKAILVIGLLIGLSQLGIELGPALAGLGIAGIAIGFALQDTLSNFASGIMILIYRPFDVGDILDAAGVSGTVREMNLVSTTILTFDNRTLIVPNNKIWGDTIQNVTAQAHRRVDLEFGVSYDDDLGLVEKVLHRVVEEHELVLEEPAPIIKLHRMDDSALVFICRPWTERDHYWTVYWDLMSRVKEQFDAHGISIPFPQRDVHLYRSGAAEGAPAPAAPSGEIEDEARETGAESEQSPPPNDG